MQLYNTRAPVSGKAQRACYRLSLQLFARSKSLLPKFAALAHKENNTCQFIWKLY